MDIRFSQRLLMVERHVAARGIRNDAVLRAMTTVPREVFVPAHTREFSYDDRPLPIGEGQTISQPYMVAWMAEAAALEGDERVLEVGTGSGYGAAVLGKIAREVYTIERHASLARASAGVIAELGYDNVTVVQGDGSLGLSQHAPFDAVVVTAGAPEVPRALLDQLALGGRLVIPVGDRQHGQSLRVITRTGEFDYGEKRLGSVRFVPLVGEQAWKNEEEAGGT